MTDGIGRISAEQFWTEQVRLTPLTSDPADSEEGELWLRADLAEEDDQLVTLRLDTGGSTVDIPVFDVGADVPDDVSTQLRLVVDGQQGFVPMFEDGGSIPQLGVWSDGVRHEAIEELFVLPDALRNQYLVEDFESDVWPDSKGTSDIDDISELSLNEDAFGGDGGVSSDGSGYGYSDTMGDFGSNIGDTDWALAIGFNTEDLGYFLGTEDPGNLRFFVGTDSWGLNARDGYLDLILRDEEGGGDVVVETDHEVTDGSERVYLIQKTGPTTDDIEIYDSPDNDVSEVRESGTIDTGDWENFDQPMAYYGRNRGGSTPDDLIEADMSDIYWFDDSLDEDSRQWVFDQYD